MQWSHVALHAQEKKALVTPYLKLIQSESSVAVCIKTFKRIMKLKTSFWFSWSPCEKVRSSHDLPASARVDTTSRLRLNKSALILSCCFSAVSLFPGCARGSKSLRSSIVVPAPAAVLLLLLSTVSLFCFFLSEADVVKVFTCFFDGASGSKDKISSSASTRDDWEICF